MTGPVTHAQAAERRGWILRSGARGALAIVRAHPTATFAVEVIDHRSARLGNPLASDPLRPVTYTTTGGFDTSGYPVYS